MMFHKRATKYRALLLKMTYKDKGSYESSPPCTRASYLDKDGAKIAHLFAVEMVLAIRNVWVRDDGVID